MNIFKRILGHVYYFYGMIVFIITLILIALVPSWIVLQIPEPKRARIIRPIYNFWMHLVLWLVFCPVRRVGKDYFKKGQTYVVLFNHNSFVDIMVSTPWTPGANKTLAKDDLAKIPIFGVIYRTGSILVTRDSEASRKQSFVEMQNTLKMGLNLILYPEGTRNKTNNPLGEFKDGAFINAIRSQKPIVPGVLFNTKKILPPRPKFWAWPAKIEVHFLPPIETKGMSLREIEQLKNRIYQQMHDYIVQHQKS